MPVIALYILKLSVCLAVLFLFYRLALHRLTFYNFNRWYLLGSSMLAFVIPLVDISPVLQQQNLSANSVVQWVPVFSNVPAATTFTTWNLIIILLLTGMAIMLVRLVLQFFSFKKMLKNATVIWGGKAKVYHVDENIIPFSFGQSIFVNSNLHTENELTEIIRHEFVHVRQVHSLDIIVGELLCLLNWYNPFAWMLKKAIRQNLEFIADEKVLQHGIERKEYQYLLLKVMGNNTYSIANQFNFYSLKKRIAMMNKLKSTNLHLVKFLFVLPILGIILLSFRKQLKKSETAQLKYDTVVSYDTIPPAKKRPANVTGIGISIKTNKATVRFKDGTKEEYDLNDDSQIKIFKDKYGELPPPPPTPKEPLPPPPPPLPPLPPLPPAPPPPPALPGDV
ncbi:MAG: M56 family metallopeptidase [Ferruginibacter sp.]|nr:M56 family metallopeptidase [Ferruginibacter sp.]